MLEGNHVWVRRLDLEHVRVYAQASIVIPPEGLRVVGRNGSGKSTLIEAIEFLSTTRPRRGALDADLVAHDSGVELGVAPYARISADIQRGDVAAKLEMFVQKGERRGTTKKLLRVADRPRRASDVVGIVPAVSFAPDDLDLVLGSPSVRRRYLDILLSQTDRRYLRTLSRYARIVSQRNGLLKRSQTEGGTSVSIDEFAYWDDQLVALGAYIIAARSRALRQIRDVASREFRSLSPLAGDLNVEYVSTIRERDGWWDTVVSAADGLEAAQRVGVTLEQQLRASRELDISRGSTTIGPHRDDVSITLDERPFERFGSRGQQRLAVIALKLAEIAAAEKAAEVRPILLLDDVLSELDEEHRELLIGSLQLHPGQMIVTATEFDPINLPELDRLELVTLQAPGVIHSSSA